MLGFAGRRRRCRPRGRTCHADSPGLVFTAMPHAASTAMPKNQAAQTTKSVAPVPLTASPTADTGCARRFRAGGDGHRPEDEPNGVPRVRVAPSRPTRRLVGRCGGFVSHKRHCVALSEDNNHSHIRLALPSIWIKSRLVRLMDIAETGIAQNQHTIDWRVDEDQGWAQESAGVVNNLLGESACKSGESPHSGDDHHRAGVGAEGFSG